MANTTKPAETAKEERVELFIPRGHANEEPNKIVCVNGVLFVLPRGKTSLVPPYVKEEYDRAQRAQDVLDAHVEQMLETAQ